MITRLLALYAATLLPLTIPAAERIAPPRSEVAIPTAVRTALEARLQELAGEIAKVDEATLTKPALAELLPDVLVYQKAVDWALRYDEFFHTNQFKIADALLATGLERARQLQAGVAPWTESSGLVIRGYQSRVDGSIQPYALVIPDGWRNGSARRFRLDVWLHGRDETLTELKFIEQRSRQPGEFAPADAFVLHPYGRYCNAFKFAGETDVFEAMAAVQRHYPIDDERLAIRGFSMGGGGTWHLAAHHPGTWAVAAPGAGFAESAEYLGKLKKEPFPPAWEQTMWGLYDATDYAANFFNLPLVAYSGQIDKQIQAAQIMEQHLAGEGMTLRHVIGAGAGHKYTPEAKAEISAIVDGVIKAGKAAVPNRIKFTTRTLRYARSHWVQIEGMSEHWQSSRVEADIADHERITIATTNVTALRLQFGAGELPLKLIAGDNATGRPAGTVRITIDGQSLDGVRARTDRSLDVTFYRQAGTWHSGPQESGLRKRPGLQGPVDDAFYDSFLMVPPTGPGQDAAVDDWVKRELAWTRMNWRGTFRGDAREKPASDVTAEDIASHHLILWGDPQSNALLQRVLARLPVQWTAQIVRLAGQEHSASTHVPVLIFPNPLNPEKYVVLNSGFTFRAFGSNADQTPKLPDYALIDVTKPASGVAPGGVATAGFFNESWQLNLCEVCTN